VTEHGSEPSLVAGHVSIIGEIEVPGHVGAMIELHLGQRGVPSMGVTAQVPHYLVQFEYPRAAMTLLDGVAAATGLTLPTTGLEVAARRAEDEVAEQLEGNEEFASVVTALEQQYDQMAGISEGAAGGLADLADSQMPTGDEIAAQVEQFLSSLDSPEDDDKQ
jgi:predicted ATP-grasp superfamily ATP-dependent carboligase